MPISSLKLADILGARHLGDDSVLAGLNSLINAKSGELALVLWPKDILLAKKTRASALLCDLSIAAEHGDEFSCPFLVIDDLAVALYKITEMGLFSPNHQISMPQSVFIHESAIVEAGAILGEGVRIGAKAVVKASVILEENVRVGEGSVIGCDAFVPYGVSPSKNLPSLGGVLVKKNAVIKAGCAIDRGLVSLTTVGENTLIDNLVHVGHDVCIGDNVIIAAQSGLAGFARVDNDVVIAGQCGIGPHVWIGCGARISGKTFVHKDVKPREVWSGNPAVPHAKYLSAYKNLLRL